MRAQSFLTLVAFVCLVLPINAQADLVPPNPITQIRVGSDQTKALQINEAIFQAIGFGNTFLVMTKDGNVIIDTSIAFNATRHKQLLEAVSKAPVKYIILTHAHGDHTGGVAAWKQPDTQIIAQKNHVEFQHYQTRLGGFYARNNAAQFALRIPPSGEWKGNYAAKIEPTILFNDKYEFELGGVKFEIFHTPGETEDHLTVWIPKYKAAFIGDNYYDSFPNIYTLRGTQPRWALDYVNSLNKVMSLKPELVLPSHGFVLRGNPDIATKLTRYRDAIQYVHDETVKGMNTGKDVWKLMDEIKLPTTLDIGESYGKLAWSVRGIYEGYVGWFDMKPASVYETPVAAVYPELVKLAGADAVVKLASEHLAKGQATEALHFAEIVLTSNARHRNALEAKLKALAYLRDKCRNSNERGWLEHFIRETKQKLEGK